MYVAPGVGLSGALHIVARRPYLAGAVAVGILVLTLMKPIPVPPPPPSPAVPASWSSR
jgi:hypothetical protein